MKRPFWRRVRIVSVLGLGLCMLLAAGLLGSKLLRSLSTDAYESQPPRDPAVVGGAVVTDALPVVRDDVSAREPSVQSAGASEAVLQASDAPALADAARVALRPIDGISDAEQRLANEEANRFVLPYATYEGEPDVGDPSQMVEGNARVRPGEDQDIREGRVAVVKRVLPNKIRLARINEQRAKQGLPRLVAGKDINVAPLGQDMVLEPVVDNARVSGGGDAGDAVSGDAVSGGGDTGEPVSGGGEEPVAGGGDITYVDNTQFMYFPPIGSQYGNQCVSWAEIYYNTTYGVAMMNGWDAKNGGDEYRFSPMHTFNFVNNGNNEYTYYTDALKIAQYNGVLRYNEKSTKSDVKTWNTDSAQYLRALTSRIKGYSYINNLSTTGLQTLKDHLANGNIVVFASYGMNSYTRGNLSDDPATTEDDAFVGQQIAYASSTSGGHARSIVGYNDHLWYDKNNNSVVDPGEKGALLFADQQGTGYANGGLCWMTYAAVSNFASFNMIWNDRVYVPLFKAEAHEPKIVARITLNHKQRNQVKVQLGMSNTGSSSPTTLVGSGMIGDCINNTAPDYQGGPYSFSGLSPVSEDFTYYLDFDDALPAMGTTNRWYVRAIDSTTLADSLTLKEFDLCQVAGTNLNVIASASGLPKTISDTTTDTYIEWTYGPVTDSDADGLDDYWETSHFGNLDQGANDDPDGDGLTNLEEYYGGTDPTVAETDIKATGTVIGTDGSYGGNPDYTKYAAFDGDLSTWYDAANAKGDWAGLDLGSPKEITMIKFAPRSGWGFRLEGGMFQVSSTDDFSSDVVTFHTIVGWPASDVLTVVPVSLPNTYRYIRYIGSDSVDNYNCLAELEVYVDFAPDAPTGLSATQAGSQVDLDWDDNTDLDLDSYNVYRSTTSGDYGAALATNVPDSAYSDDTVSSGNTYYYVVEAVDTDGNVSAKSAEASVAFMQNLNAPVVDAGTNQSLIIEGFILWTPAEISSAGWYDASDASTITEDSGAVSEWRDKSGNDLHLGQEITDNQPKVGVNTINNKTTVKFDGSNDTLETSRNPFTSIEDAFVIMVHRHDASANATIFNLSGTADSSGRYQAHAPYGTTFYFDAGSTGNRISAAYGASVGDEILMSCYGSITESKQEVYKNGSLLVSGSNPGTVASPPGNIFIGSSAGIQYQNTSIGEVIIINGTVSTNDRQKLEGYLAHKWGLSGSIPEGHPYKVSAPGVSGVSVTLDATVTDADGQTPDTLWTQVSGTGTVVFADATAVDTTAIINAPDTYILQLVADDGLYRTTNNVTITVSTPSDTDGDGMYDDWEIANFGDLSQGPDDDFDGDGHSNLTEFINGTDPTVDQVPPAVPANFSVTDTNDLVALSWDANTEPDFDSYTLYRSRTSGSGFVATQSNLTGTTYVDNLAVNGTEYFYYITAADTNGNEASSSEISATPVGLPLVSMSSTGLLYKTYANEGQTNNVNTVPDYSRAGYGGGGVEIPFVPAEVTLTDDGASDDTTRIQNAIDTVSALPVVGGFRGAVLLKAGEYTVSGTLNINTSGVVIRGEGQQDSGGTKITLTATNQIDLFRFAGSGGPALTGSSTAITDSYVPVGSRTLNVADGSTYAPGDLIRITYLMNQQWIDDIGMTVEGGLLGTVEDPEWDPAWFQLRHYRYVVSVDGNALTLDTPIMQAIETQYGGGTVQECTYAGAIENVGIENIRLESTYVAEDDEQHGWQAVVMLMVKNGWARQITSRYFGMGLILLDDSTQYVTVEDCACLDPKSITTGGRKYSFQVDDCGYNLVQRTLTRGGRHDYASGSVTPGPNVFVDGHATQAVEDIGPHFRYATGELYDNIKSDSQINVQNRVNAGTTHGWAGAQIMFWNVDANTIICDAPVGAMNWSIGAVGAKTESPSYMSPWEPFGIWQSHNTHVTPRSLYYAQLEERLGSDVLNAVMLPEQKSGTIWDALQSWDGDGLFLDGVVCWITEGATQQIDTVIGISARIRDLNVQENLASVTWSKSSGPGTVTFGDDSLLETTASFDQRGTYVLLLSADDGVRQATGSLELTIIDPNYVPPPLAPTGLVATAGDGFISLDWNGNTESNVTYTLYRSQTSGSGFSVLQDSLVTSAYTDNAVSNGTTYYYRVTASVPGSDESPSSVQVSATPNAEPTFADATIVKPGATEGVAYSSSLAGDASDADDDPLSFSKLSGPDWLAVATNGALSGTPAGTDAGMNEWTVEVDDGNGGTDQATLQITVEDVAPAAPTGLQASAGNNMVTLDWADNGESDIAGYTAYRSTTSGSGYVAIATNLPTSDYSDSSAANDTTYYYVVSVTDDGGNESVMSAEVSATPEAPSTVMLAATDNAYIRASALDTIYDVSQEIRAHRSFVFGAREAWIRIPLSGENQIGGVDIDSVDSVTLELYSNLASTHTMVVFALLDAIQYDGTTLSETTWTGGTAGTEATGANLTTNKRPLGPTDTLPVANKTTGVLGSAQNVDAPGILQIAITDLEAFKQLVRNDTNGEITLLLNSNGSDDWNSFASVFNTQGKQVPTLVIEQQVAPPLYTLTVTSEHGTASPPQGVTTNTSGTKIDAYILDSPITLAGNTTQYVCTGWSRTGSEPSAGTGTNTSFTITNDTTITWQWQTNYWIEFEVRGE